MLELSHFCSVGAPRIFFEKLVGHRRRSGALATAIKSLDFQRFSLLHEDTVGELGARGIEESLRGGVASHAQRVPCVFDERAFFAQPSRE